MVSTGEAVLYAGGGLVASEALGITNFSEGSGMSPEALTEIVSSAGGNVSEGIGGGTMAALMSQIQGQNQELPSGDDLGLGELGMLTQLMGDTPGMGDIQEMINQSFSDIPGVGGQNGDSGVIPPWVQKGISESRWRELYGGSQNGGGNGGSTPTDPTPNDPYDNPSAGIQIGDIPSLVGDTFGAGADFVGENPYLSLGAASPDPITTGLGAAVEVGADTVTGGTPLGVDSPIDLTSGGAWWQGPDPLGLGGNNNNTGNNRGEQNNSMPMKETVSNNPDVMPFEDDNESGALIPGVELW